MFIFKKEHIILVENIERKDKYKDIEVSGRAEADILRDVIVHHFGINEEQIIIENKSINCGSNAREALKVLKEDNRSPESVILIQDPMMQLRTYASFQKEWKEEKNTVFINYSPFVPYIKPSSQGFTFQSNTDVIYGLWEYERFLSLMMGEIPRLTDDENGYGPRGKGYISHVDIPLEVLQAYKQLSSDFICFTNMRNVGNENNSLG
jgi:uncharacterized SAM-binding protein YcdF (DUF218 family)